MKQRFHALTILATIIKVIGILNALVVIAGGALSSILALASKQVGLGIWGIIGSLVIGASALFFYWIVAELILLMLSIERNTHESAELLKQQQHLR